MDFYLDPENCYQRLEDEFKKYGKLIFCVDSVSYTHLTLPTKLEV